MALLEDGLRRSSSHCCPLPAAAASVYAQSRNTKAAAAPRRRDRQGRTIIAKAVPLWRPGAGHGLRHIVEQLVQIRARQQLPGQNNRLGLLDIPDVRKRICV